MDRLLTHVRSRSLLLISPTRSLSSFKPNSFDFKSRVLLNQLDASKSKSSNPSSNIDLTYEYNSFFPLPGHVGFCHEPKTLPQLNSNQQLINIQTNSSLSKIKNEKEFLLKLINSNNNLEIRSYDCSLALRSQLKDLFLNYNTLTQPLTAITIIFKTNSDMSTWSMEVENERYQLAEQFIKLAREICKYLNTNQYWVDFIDPSNGKPYYGPSTSDALFETDERFQHFGINAVDLGCCRVIEHLQYGTHVFVGCIFTSVPKMDSNVQHLLKEFLVPNYSK